MSKQRFPFPASYLLRQIRGTSVPFHSAAEVYLSVALCRDVVRRTTTILVESEQSMDTLEGVHKYEN